MRPQGLLLCFVLAATGPVFSQAPKDSTFSLIINNNLSFTHANDPHINRWLTRYGYAAEPHVPESLNFEVAAIPESSRILYSLKVSTIVSAHNLSSFNILGGIYGAIVKKQHLLVFAGFGAGYHSDIITLNGDMPADYKELAAKYDKQLSLRRAGLFVEPALRAFWFPVSFHNVQLGLFAGLGYDMDFNSHWKLGYYETSPGKSNKFKKLNNPSDQQKVSEFGISYNAGLTLRIHLN